MVAAAFAAGGDKTALGQGMGRLLQAAGGAALLADSPSLIALTLPDLEQECGERRFAVAHALPAPLPSVGPTILATTTTTTTTTTLQLLVYGGCGVWHRGGAAGKRRSEDRILRVLIMSPSSSIVPVLSTLDLFCEAFVRTLCPSSKGVVKPLAVASRAFDGVGSRVVHQIWVNRTARRARIVRCFRLCLCRGLSSLCEGVGTLHASLHLLLQGFAHAHFVAQTGDLVGQRLHLSIASL